MSRELRFRVWDNQEKRFCNEDHDFGFSNKDYLIFNGKTFLKTKRYEIRQWTGLKDKNGVEIYDGDFLKGEKFPVVLNWTGEFVIRMFNKDSGPSNPLWVMCESRKIVGNIFENPELLK